MKETFLLIGIIVFLVLFFPIQANTKSGPKTELYIIEQLTPEILRVVGNEPTAEKARINYNWGFGDAFAEAIERIGIKYIIEEITPISYDAGRSSVTQELLIKVKRRE